MGPIYFVACCVQRGLLIMAMYLGGKQEHLDNRPNQSVKTQWTSSAAKKQMVQGLRGGSPTAHQDGFVLTQVINH